MKANIVIFGKNSIIAQNFIKDNYCKKNNIIGISRNNECEDEIYCDIGKPLLSEEIEKIINKIKKKIIYEQTIFILFSWYGGPRITADKDDIWSTNMNIIQNFIAISRIISPSRIIFLSSAGSLYPENKKSFNFPETFKPIPTNSYGKQKLVSEKLLTYFAETQKQQLTILRIASAYGFDKRFSDQGVINKWLYSAINSKKIQLYNSKESQINFISFKNISRSIIISLQNELNGIYNVGSQKSVSLEEVIEEIQNTVNKKIEIEELNNSDRFFNIDTTKFNSKTGEIFQLNLRENIKLIYEAIIKQSSQN